MEKVFEIYIRTTPERLWEAITDPEIRSKYNFGARVDLGLDARLALRDERPGPRLLGEGENLEVDPPRRLVQSMIALWSDDVKSEGTSRVTWEIEPVGDSCRLTVTHDQLREGANDQLYGGWPMILSGLKTWLETGELLTTPGSLHVHLSAARDGRPYQRPSRAGTNPGYWSRLPVCRKRWRRPSTIASRCACASCVPRGASRSTPWPSTAASAAR